MTDPQATQSQLSFISKLRNASPERDEIFQKFVKAKGKSDSPELTMQEAYALIDEMKKAKFSGSDMGTSGEEVFVTGKQITFLTRLQDTDERKNASRKYFDESRKYSINALSTQEASKLIDILSGMKGVDRGDPTDSPATRKQLQFIKNLQGTDKRMDTTSGYLKELKKTDLSELTRKEASTLIDRLKG